MTAPHDTASRPRTRPVVLVAAGVVIACLLAAAAIAVLLPSQDEPDVVRESEAPLPGSIEKPPSAAPTIEDEADSVAFLIMASSGGWAAHITGVEVVAILRRPVIVVATDIGPEQAGVSDEFASALASFAGGLTADGGSPYTYYLQIRSSEGDVIGVIRSTDQRWALETPAVPVDAGTLRAWLDSVYGSGAAEPEAWVGRITDVRADADGTVVVRTDLDPGSIDDQRAAQTIIDAVNSSGATFAPGIRVIFNDGDFEWSALLDGIDPYGP